MNPKHLKILAAILILLAIWRVTKLFQGTPPPQEAFLHYRALAVGAAEHTAKLIEGSGPVVLVLPAGDEPYFTAQIEAFRKEGQALGLGDVAVVRAKPGDYHNERGWSVAFYERVAAEHAGAHAIVSFTYAPPISVALGRTPRKTNAKFVAVLPDSGSLGLYFRAGLVDLAILPANAIPGNEPGVKAPPKVWFDAYYEVLDAPEGEALPEPEGDQHMFYLTDEERDSDSPF